MLLAQFRIPMTLKFPYAKIEWPNFILNAVEKLQSEVNFTSSNGNHMASWKGLVKNVNAATKLPPEFSIPSFNGSRVCKSQDVTV